MEKDAYFLGLDMGTSTVGWAVTDPEYHILRKKGKDLWGIREFEEAKTAADRRSHRIARKNIQKDKVRRGILRDYFADAINAIDPNFYQRLDNSKYFLEDKDEEVQTLNGVFNDPNYKDKDYFKQYPSIYHLRRELIQDDKPHDVRLVYLAIANIFKHRGHFLNSSLKADEETGGRKLHEEYQRLSMLLEEKYPDQANMQLPEISSDEVFAKFEELLGSREYSKKRKVEQLSELLGVDKKSKKTYMMLNGFCGLTMNCKDLFDMEELEEKLDVKFSDFSYADKEPEIMDKLGEEYGEIVQSIKTIYDIGALTEILKGEDYLSCARVKDYEQHHKDLRVLKRVVKKYVPDKYDEFFRKDNAGSYSAYVNSSNSDDYYEPIGNGKKRKIRRNMKDRKRDDFYKSVKTLLKGHEEDEDVKTILTSIEKETFMPKQLTAFNGVIPNQIHARELNRILNNAQAYLPFLNEIDESGLSVKERIFQLFTFTVPYYIGPISENSKTGWVTRLEPGRVFPWNLEQKIDVSKTSEDFINRMVRRCTYMHGEQVLPKCSVKYQKYCVLNEINNIRVDGEKLDPKMKQELFNELYKPGRKVTRKRLEQWLHNQCGIDEKAVITGIDKELNNVYSSYAKFRDLFGDMVDTDSGKKMIEDIIFKCTVYSDAKNRLKEYLKESYPELSSKAIERICGFKMKDWGRMSQRFLDLEGVDYETGEVMTLLQAMWETNLNLMELIYNADQFSFKNELEKQEKDSLQKLSDITPQVLQDEFYFSAPVRKMVMQTIEVLREIMHVMGVAPERIFLEMTRSDEEKGDKGRKDSRKKQLLDLYKNIKDETHGDSKWWTELIEKESDSGRLRSKKMYLYLRQMGRDMYTGEVIDLEELFTAKYDIDHVYPRHFVKDDNLENNLVLVRKEENANKTDDYPLPLSIRNDAKVQALWERLHISGLLNDVKYSRLRGNSPLTEEQKADFIARQLVETGQAAKGIADILKLVLPKTKIVYSKAGNVSDFRRDYDFYKSRLINDEHHAQDAYLNIVVGNVYYTKFKDNPLNFIKKEYRANSKDGEYNLGKMFQGKVERNGYVAWTPASKGEESGSIVTVRKMMNKHTPIVSKQCVEGSGQLADQTLYGAKMVRSGNAETYMPLKSNDTKLLDKCRYGGFTNAKTAYFFLVEHTVKGKRVRTLEMVPIYLAKSIERDSNQLEAYCQNELSLSGFSIRVRKIKLNSLLKINGFHVRIAGRTGNQISLRNSVGLVMNSDWVRYIKEIEKSQTEKNQVGALSAEKNDKLYLTLLDKHKGIYSKRPNPVFKTLENGYEEFNKLNLRDQSTIIQNILKLTSMSSSSADLKKIGGSSQSGVMLTNKDITKTKELLLVNQSVTGLFENVIDLKTV